jgi:hypothetical protein
MKNIKKWEKGTAERNRYLKKHPDCDDSVKDGMCESMSKWALDVKVLNRRLPRSLDAGKQ